MLNWDEYGKEETTSPPITPEIKKETTALDLVYWERVDSLTVFASSGSSFKSSCSKTIEFR